MGLTAESLVNQSLEQKSVPSIYLQLNKLLRDPDTPLDDFSTVINTDPALASHLLRIINSPFYGFPSKIETISRAITIIGHIELVHLVLARSVINIFRGIPASLIDMNEFWRHAFATAITAKLLAETCDQKASEAIFISGLLHNIGSLVLYRFLPEPAAEAMRRAKLGHEVQYQAERRIIGFDHSEVGYVLARQWQLPPSMLEVVRYHHHPSDARDFPVDVAIIHIADILVAAVPFGHSGDDHVPPLDPVAWDLLALNELEMPLLLQQVSEQLDHLCSVMLTQEQLSTA